MRPDITHQYAAKFGASYELLVRDAEIAPHVSGRKLHAVVRYSSACADPSTFSTNFVGEEKIQEEGLGFEVLALVRSEEECEGTPTERTEVVQVDLSDKAVTLAQDDTAMLFLAFPPDGEYEMSVAAVGCAIYDVSAPSPTHRTPRHQVQARRLDVPHAI